MYLPKGKRKLILMENEAFPSDVYAVKSFVRSRGLGSFERDDYLTLINTVRISRP